MGYHPICTPLMYQKIGLLQAITLDYPLQKAAPADS
jgi:hypothetical protein